MSSNKINKNLNNFSIFAEVIIGFGTFSIFFGIFMIYFFTQYEVSLLGNFIKESISFYTNTKIIDKLEIDKLINDSSKVKLLKAEVNNTEKEVSEHNKPYDTKLIYIILGMILSLLFLLIIPVILGIIRLDQINFKYIGFSIILHIILIVGFELLFLILILSYINPVKIYNILKNNKAKTGSYI